MQFAGRSAEKLRAARDRFEHAFEYARRECTYRRIRPFVFASVVVIAGGTMYFELSARFDSSFSTAIVYANQYDGVEAVVPTSELSIANSGFVHIEGARIVSISAPRIIAKSTWGSTEFTWSVVTGDQTRFIRPDGEASTLSELAAGNYIDISGRLVAGSTGLIVDASSVRNVSGASEQENEQKKLILLRELER